MIYTMSVIKRELGGEAGVYVESWSLLLFSQQKIYLLAPLLTDEKTQNPL